MKSKNSLSLIIKIKNIHEFNRLRLNLWILSTQKSSIPHSSTLYHGFALNKKVNTKKKRKKKQKDGA
jgi:hypothetical protein